MRRIGRALTVAALALVLIPLTVHAQSTPSNVARGNTSITTSAPLTSSSAPVSALTDGRTDTNPFISLPPGPQYVRLDLGQKFNITRIHLWHYWGDGRTYHDVIVQLSPDGSTWWTMFNSDADNSVGQGAGHNSEYRETYLGNDIRLYSPVTARFVRSFTNGSTVNAYNHHVELQVYGTPDMTVYRDPFRQPFLATSPFNFPIGSGATFERATDPRTRDITDPALTTWINHGLQQGVPVYRSQDTDPLVPLYRNGVVVTRIRVPATARTAGEGDSNLIVVDTAGYAHEMWRALKRDDGGWNIGHYVKTDLYSSGIVDGTRAAKVSLFGGLIRAGELRNGYIPHVLVFVIPISKEKRGPIWPAHGEDSYADRYYGNVQMGVLAAIPPDIDLTKLQPPLSREGLALGRALQDIGAYHFDSTWTHPTFAVMTEVAAASEVTDTVINDLKRLRPLLRVVTNANRPEAPGGPGAPRVPMAPPLQPR